jgi:hypothetical protein
MPVTRTDLFGGAPPVLPSPRPQRRRLSGRGMGVAQSALPSVGPAPLAVKIDLEPAEGITKPVDLADQARRPRILSRSGVGGRRRRRAGAQGNATSPQRQPSGPAPTLAGARRRGWSICGVETAHRNSSKDKMTTCCQSNKTTTRCQDESRWMSRASNPESEGFRPTGSRTSFPGTPLTLGDHRSCLLA